MSETIPDVSARVAERADVQERVEAGRVVLVRQRFTGLRRRVLLAFGVRPELTVRLDPLGSAAWRLVDGHRTVAQIKAELERQFPGEADVGPRLGRFLGMLVSRELVRLR